MPVNLIAEERERGTNVGEFDKERSRLRGPVQDGTESPGFFTANAGLVLKWRCLSASLSICMDSERSATQRSKHY